MIDALITTALTVFALALYISAGKAHWVLSDLQDALLHPELAETCPFRASLKAGHFGAHFTKWCFVVFWPFWLTIGWFNARREDIVQRLRGQ